MREGLKAQSRELFRWCFWLLLWELAARLLHNRLLLVGPLETIGVLFRMALGASYWQAVRNSTLRVLGGFLTGALAGIGLAVLAEKREGLRWILSPFVNVIKAIPVASFIVILLICLFPDFLPEYTGRSRRNPERTVGGREALPALAPHARSGTLPSGTRAFFGKRAESFGRCEL